MKHLSINLKEGDIIPVFSDEGYLAEFNIVRSLEVESPALIRIHVDRWVKGSRDMRTTWIVCGLKSTQYLLELR